MTAPAFRAGPGFSGTVLSDPDRNEVYVKYRGGPRRGAGKSLVFFWKDGVSYFNDHITVGEHGGWLQELAGRALALKGGERRIRAEFSLHGATLSLSGPVGVPAWSVPGNAAFKFENELNYNFHYTDFSDRDANAILGALGLTARIKSELNDDGLFLRYSVLEALEDELRCKAADLRFARTLYRVFLNFLLEGAKGAATGRGGNAAALFAALKNLNFKLAFFNYLLNRTLKYSLDGRRRDLSAGEFRAYRKSLLPRISPALRDLLAAFKETPGSFDTRYGTGALAALKKAPAFRKLLARKPAPARPIGRHEPLRGLTELKNSSNSRFSVISAAYTAGLVELDGRLAGADIHALCRLPLTELTTLLRKKLFSAPEARHTGGESPVKLRASFPLKGVTAQAGSISGKARIARRGADLAGISRRDILVADYPGEEFLAPLLLCGGVVTGRGGPDSMAATLARELRKPCIADVRGCAAILKDGDRIMIKDGGVHRA